MIIPALKRKLCRDLLIEVVEDESGSIAITSFSYPNGDSVNLYFDDFGDGILSVSDQGATVSFLENQGIDLSTVRRQAIKHMCQPHDVEFVTPQLRRQFYLPDIGPACIALCEAVTAVASIFYLVEPPARSSLPVAVERMLHKRVAKKRGIQRNWIDLRHDPKGSFPVDFRMNGLGEPRNIFPVTSTSKSLMVVAVGNFLRSHRIAGRSMAIIDKEAGIGPTDVNRLSLTVDRIVRGLEGNESEIVKFALENAKS